MARGRRAESGEMVSVWLEEGEWGHGEYMARGRGAVSGGMVSV